MATATSNPLSREEPTKTQQEFVTVVSVGSQPTNVENFVTVLSIGTENKNECQAVREKTGIASPSEIHPEEEVEVFRLPGEPLGFGLKFEGGAKNAEKVKRLFVQSCAEQSPASRAKCSWGTIGEGDEVLSIDGVPVSHMSRLDCVRRLKESQLVIKLMIRCRGALRPEVVSAERKSPPDVAPKSDKIPPELPLVPPPVPPRKLRQARGSADGEANPIPAKKMWNGSPKSNSGSSSQTDSPQSQKISQVTSILSNGKSMSQESSNSIVNNSQDSSHESSKRSSNEASPEMTKFKQEPPEAMVYLDARPQDGSSTHGSVSDDTGSSMSTVVDRFSMSDRFSTVSTTSTTSGGASEHPGSSERSEDHSDENRDFRDTKRLPPFEQLEQDFLTNSSDYLLKRLANSEAVTHVDSRGEAGAVVERITAVVAPNTVLIEETLTLQPPLSFQDAPLSYGHETRPDLLYTADLAGDSTTHFRPIRDEASIVECVNGENLKNCPPSLPARNHVNRIPVNQQKISTETQSLVQPVCQTLPNPRESIEIIAPILPPKPMPRKDIKSKRKRPPPPPPPPRREPPPPGHLRGQTEFGATTDVTVVEISNVPSKDLAGFGNKKTLNNGRQIEQTNDDSSVNNKRDELNECGSKEESSNGEDQLDFSPENSPFKMQYDSEKTNKVLEIIEMKKVKAFGESTPNRSPIKMPEETRENNSCPVSPVKRASDIVPAPRDKKKLTESESESTISTEIEDSENSTGSISDNWKDAKERQDSSENTTISNNSRAVEENCSADGPAGDFIGGKDAHLEKIDDDDEDDETYRSLDEIREDFKHSETNGTLSSSEEDEEDPASPAQREGDDSTSDESEDNGDDDYYWQSNLATIGEEEETSSLEYTNANKDVEESEDKSPSEKDAVKTELRGSTIEKNETMKNASTTDVTKPECVIRISKDSVNTLTKKLGTQVNAGRMDNCGGDQRLPPDGDEFPATYQEFSGCTSEQYQYVATSTRNTQRNNGPPSNGVRDCNEIDETTSSISSTSSSFVEKSRNDSLKLVRNHSATTKNSTNNNTTTISAREKSSNYMRTTNSQPVVESRISSQYITNSLKRETILPPEVAPRSSTFVEDTNEKKSNNSYFSSSSPRATKFSNTAEPILVVSEKTFEISGYYPKENKVSSEIIVPENSEASPPPLPLTGPPKVENAVPLGKSIATPSESIPQRKFSLNGDLWRQDDKSEKSVRDKIAMFSSQSSLETPLFPSQASPIPVVINNVTTNGRRLSKYKSSEDVFCDDKIQESKEMFSSIERTRSSVDLSDSRKMSTHNEPIIILGEKYEAQRAPSLPKTLPPEEEPTLIRNDGYSTKTLTNSSEHYQKPSQSISEKSVIIGREFTSSEFNNSSIKNASVKPVVPPRNINNSSLAFSPKSSNDKDSFDLTQSSGRSSLPSLTRATSFSGESNYTNDLSQLTTANVTGTNGQISRTNSLASTFRRNSEDMRRQSLNQLIEQRRKGISKLRGLVIPEKNAVPIDKPIIDLPEIKSRDSILLHQVPKASIQDKWGSQSSIASTTSSVSSPLKATTSFKMPAPQIMSKYSPAFKRKSLTVYGTSSASSSAANTPPSTRRPSPTNSHSTIIPEPPKSLESICSPTRSDYSFEYVSSTSVSPETGMRGRPRPGQRKIRADYDDSDNDSAVSSSQSSISRGFSPPTSPAPSERSSISSERSYHTSLIMEMPSRNYSIKDTNYRSEKNNYLTSHAMYSDNRTYPSSERSSSGSSSGSSPNPRSPQPEINPRNSHIPQRQMLKRSSSTETNCSSASSSTLTSGSQASAESLSRRVLKPQSVEAINRKNILASARCRSGRDLNGSPLIQRKFSDDEELPVSSLAQENGTSDHARQSNGNVVNDSQDVKIAYIEVTEIITEDDNSTTSTQVIVEDKKESIMNVNMTGKCTSSNLMEASNDLKMWVRSEAKALMAEMPKQRISDAQKVSQKLETTEPISPVRNAPRNRSSLTLDDPRYSSILETWNKNSDNDDSSQLSELRKSKSVTKGSTNDEVSSVDSSNDDLLTTLTTKSRSRAPINLEDRTFSRTSRQMSLEDILVGKPEPKLVRAQSVTIDSGIEKNNYLPYPGSQTKIPPTTSPRNNIVRPNLKESWSEDRSFVSKIPTFGRANKTPDHVDDSARIKERSRNSKIPTQKPLDRRSASVTDMKKALEKNDSGSSFNVTSTNNNQSPAANAAVHHHHRFSSLDSSVEEKTRFVGHEPENERFNGEQFGSISSLASSTSLISQQELAQLVEEASSLEDARGTHDVVVVLLHKENPHGSVGITLAGGVDCEAKEITVHRVLAHSVADKDGRVQRGDRILSINGRSTRGLNHRESLAVLKQPRSEVVLVVSRSRLEEGSRLRARTDSVETIVEGSEACATFDDTAWGPATRVAIFKDGAGLGFSLAGGRDSPLGDRPLVIKKIFTGGAAEKTAALTAGDQLLEVNGIDVTRMSRIEAWSLMKKLSDGEANLLVRHPATKSS